MAKGRINIGDEVAITASVQAGHRGPGKRAHTLLSTPHPIVYRTLKVRHGQEIELRGDNGC